MYKKCKKTMPLVLSGVMLLCGVPTLAAEQETGYQINENLNLEEEVTLNIYGPGLFSSGEEGVTDLVTNLYKPGYNEIIARWNELYPNCSLVIENIPWDNYTNAITTAALDGSIDVMVHGHIDGLAEDLRPYLEAEPEFTEQLFTYTTVLPATTNIAEENPIQGLAIHIEPMVVWCDKEIFEHYGVELPTDAWTYYDLIEIAEKLTGIDPVTGEQTYGIQYYSPSGANLQFNYTLAALATGTRVFTLGETKEDCLVDFATEESIEALQIIHDYAQYAAPEIREGAESTTTIDGTNNWAMMMESGSLITNTVICEENGWNDRYVVVNMPTCQNSDYEGIPTPWAGETTLAIYKDSEKKDWAWEFIKFMTTDEVAVDWVAQNMLHPNNKKGLEYYEEFYSEETYQVVERALTTLPEDYNNSWNRVRNGRIAAINGTAMVQAVDNVIKEYMSAEEAAEYMQEEAEAAMLMD